MGVIKTGLHGLDQTDKIYHLTQALQVSNTLPITREVLTLLLVVWRPGAGGNPHMKGLGMLVVSLRGVNFGFWSHLGCRGQNAIVFSREGLV